MYLDEKGLIVQRDGDAGDCLQREGFWFEACYLNRTIGPVPGLAPYGDALRSLATPQGFVRSWQARGGPPPWNTPSDTSRDQLVSNIRACGYYGNGIELAYIFKSVVKNFSRFPNGDIAFINDYGRFIRAFDLWYLWPLLLICDIPIVVNTLIRCWKSRDYDNVGDDINHIGDLAQAFTTFPTPVSLLARKLYKWWRPSFAVVAIGVVKARGPGYLWALSWYFRPASNANPEFIDAWTPVVNRF